MTSTANEPSGHLQATSHNNRDAARDLQTNDRKAQRQDISNVPTVSAQLVGGSLERESRESRLQRQLDEERQWRQRMEQNLAEMNRSKQRGHKLIFIFGVLVVALATVAVISANRNFGIGKHSSSLNTETSQPEDEGTVKATASNDVFESIPSSSPLQPMPSESRFERPTSRPVQLSRTIRPEQAPPSRAITVRTFVNSITLSGEKLVYPSSSTAEERALQWLIDNNDVTTNENPLIQR